MSVHPGRLALVAAALLLAGCAHPRSEPEGLRTNMNVISREQMRDEGFNSVYDALFALRPHWLRPRGPDSFRTPTEVWVYMESNRLGGVETLKRIWTAEVEYVRYYDGISASARWGIGHGQGVVYLSTTPLNRRSSDAF
jgi:hypothetical protein